MTRQNSRPTKKSQKHRKKNPAVITPRPTFNIKAVVKGKVMPFARLYKGIECKTLAKTRCEVFGPGGEDTYVVVISREKYVSEAMHLSIGEHVLLEGAYFRKPPRGRGAVEIHAKRFSRLP